MSKETNDAIQDKHQANSKFSSERLNLIIAVCAILISGASFYATYLQADAANKQVKAMTLPLLQFAHGNSLGDGNRVVNFSLKNAGIGPALIRSVEFKHQGKSFDNVFKLLNECCSDVVEKFYTQERKTNNELPQFITSPVVNTIIPGQENLVFLKFKYQPETQALWELLNEIRFEFAFEACYCSMLDECYITNEKAETTAIKQCDSI